MLKRLSTFPDLCITIIKKFESFVTFKNNNKSMNFLSPTQRANKREKHKNMKFYIFYPDLVERKSKILATLLCIFLLYAGRFIYPAVFFLLFCINELHGTVKESRNACTSLPFSEVVLLLILRIELWSEMCLSDVILDIQVILFCLLSVVVWTNYLLKRIFWIWCLLNDILKWCVCWIMVVWWWVLRFCLSSI